MRILANENVPGEMVEALRQSGHDVMWVRTDAPGSLDEEVLRRAHTEQRLILTFDKDFGELALRTQPGVADGVVLLRIRAADPAAASRIVVAALEARDDWIGHFSVVENDRIRMTPLPRSGGPLSAG